MRQTLRKRRLYALLLTVAMIFTLLPVTALAAAATGTATGTQGYNHISVNLSAGTFSADTTAVENITNWALNVTGDARTIASVIRNSATSVKIMLSAPIAAGNAFTLAALAPVFETGTEPFTTAIPVNIAVPIPAEGTATATAGTKDVSVTLTNLASFGSASAVQNISFWTLGGSSAAGNSIASVTYVDTKHATVTLTNNIGASDAYTITAGQSAFINIAIAPFASPLPVTISGGTANVCAIGSTQYPTLDAALADATGTAASPTVITLLSDITYSSALNANATHMRFALDGHTLRVNGGLSVDGGSVGYTSPGSFIISGNVDCVKATNGGRASVTEIVIANVNTRGAHASGANSSITVDGDIRTDVPHTRAIGAYAYGDGASVVVNGGIFLEGDNIYGAQATSEGKVEVKPGSGEAIRVTGADACGVDTRSGGEVTVSRGIIASGGSAVGVVANGGSGAVASVTVTDDYGTGVSAWDFGSVTVNGNVTVSGRAGKGISAIVGEGAGGTVRVTGGIQATGEDSLGVECSSRSVNIGNKSAVTIDGQIASQRYILLDETARDKNSENSVDAQGYWAYNGAYGSVVKVKNGAVDPSIPVVTPGSSSKGLPTVITEGVTDVSVSGGTFLGSVVSSGGAAVTGRGFVLSTDAAPKIGKSGATQIRSGSGTGKFSIDVGSLLPDTTYYVRAYAVNSQGTAYGETLNFTTGFIGDAQNTVPKTGDNNTRWAGWLQLGISALALSCLGVLRKRKAL